ncbi:MAG: ABC transporter permease subunit [Planctomycetes bacterium]|nr:ABC transporter permease subunit [Planctomycetota bacterium]
MRLAEAVARLCISIGGAGTIAAVALIFVFLVWVVVPLFGGAGHELRNQKTVASAAASAPPFAFGVDEYRDLGFVLKHDGTLVTWRTDDGKVLDTRALFTVPRLNSVSTRSPDGDLAFGFDDGSVRLGRISFHATYADMTSRPELAEVTADRPVIVAGGQLARRTQEGQLRLTGIAVSIDEPVQLGLTAPITALDVSSHRDTTKVVALDARGEIAAARIETRENLMTGEVTVDIRSHSVPLRPRATGPPTRLFLTGPGDVLLVTWDDGILQRHDLRDVEAPRLAEEFDLVDGEGSLTAAAFLIGKTTLITGDSRGRVRGWFGTKPAEAETPDGIRFVRTHDLDAEGPAVTALASSSRSRVVSAGFADGSVKTFHVTSHKLLIDTAVEGGEPITALVIAPKEDGLMAQAGAHVAAWNITLEHPEASLSALFAPVWYEGYDQPRHVWQSTGGTDDFEPKLGFWPLIFGTLKATFYSMLFGAPLAILAAIFTSEFLHKRLKGPLKSITEMMASLPSVVLGFIAAIVIAPYVQGLVSTVLALFFTVPCAFLLGAHLWQLLPQNAYVRLSGAPRFVAMGACLPVGVLAAFAVGPFFERTFFDGDIIAWLAGAQGDSVGGWLLLLIPVTALLYVFAASRFVGPWLRSMSAGWNRPQAARFEFARFGASLVLVFATALGAAHVLDGVGFDPRGGVFDTYVQRNALIVGFVMGFAIIPIVYTLAEDALSSVPAHLRLASLGAGATLWQTAMRVVVPTAMSGLFSAVMIGLGRAVGETMIVLMATGNTPIMSWSVFDGFRTLSANIAVELPEAVRDSTHYRALFLAALCLFALTFVLNTFAELVRQRFRKRAYQL